MNKAAVDLIASRLPTGLPHPGDPTQNTPPKLLPLPGLKSSGIPPEMAEHFAAQAGFPTADAPKLIAEAILNLLETDGGFTIIPTEDLNALHTQAADAPDGTRIITVHCPTHNTALLELTINKTDQTTIPCHLLATAIEAHH